MHSSFKDLPYEEVVEKVLSQVLECSFVSCNFLSQVGECWLKENATINMVSL